MPCDPTPQPFRLLLALLLPALAACGPRLSPTPPPANHPVGAATTADDPIPATGHPPPATTTDLDTAARPLAGEPTESVEHPVEPAEGLAPSRLDPRRVAGPTEAGPSDDPQHAGVARDRVRLPDDEPRPRPGSCADGTTGVVAVPLHIELSCDTLSANCEADSVPLAVRNCSGEPVDLLEIELDVDGHGGILQLAPEPATARLEPGARFERESFWRREGSYELRARARTLDGVPIEVAPATVEIRNPARDAALAACRECHGTWGRFGIMGFEGCDCTARDAGRQCTTDDQCEGRCLFDHWAPLEDDDPLAAGAPTCPEGQVRYVGRGTCSEHTMVFGCVSAMGENVRYDCRWPGMHGRVPTTCID